MCKKKVIKSRHMQTEKVDNLFLKNVLTPEKPPQRSKPTTTMSPLSPKGRRGGLFFPVNGDFDPKRWGLELGLVSRGVVR